MEKLKSLLKDIDTFREFFKIPVLDSEVYAIAIRLDENGEIIGMGQGGSESGSATGDIDIPDAPKVDGSDAFSFYVSAVFDDGDCYFTFDPHTYNGNLVDTSLIPGGYGIYHYTYDSKKGTIDLSNLKMVYALDVNDEFEEIRIDESGENIFLITSDKKERTMLVIDRKTMAEKDRFSLGDSDAFYSFWTYDDYMVVKTDSILVFELGENGRYTQALSVDLEKVEKAIPSSGFNANFMRWDNEFDWNGEKLLVTNGIALVDEYHSGNYTCDMFVAAIDASGLVYYGQYISTLPVDNEEGYNACTFNTDMSEQFSIRWK